MNVREAVKELKGHDGISYPPTPRRDAAIRLAIVALEKCYTCGDCTHFVAVGRTTEGGITYGKCAVCSTSYMDRYRERPPYVAKCKKNFKLREG